MQTIKCSSCYKEYTINENLEGKKVKCSKCGNIFKLEFAKNIDFIKENDNNFEATSNNEIQSEANEISNNNQKLDININKVDESKMEEDIKKNISEREEDNKIKPNKKSYLLLGTPILFFTFISLISLIFSLYLGLFLFFITFIIYIWFSIKYKKEEYIITDRKIIYHYGNLFSDNSVEINLDKVTQVSSILGFIQNKIFGTGNIRIKTAGSDSSKINLKNIDIPMDIFENIQSRMRKNGFHLLKDKVVQSAKPHWLGIVGEMFGKIIVNFILIFVILGDLFTQISTYSSTLSSSSLFTILPLFLFVIITILIVIFNYLDLKRRKYDIYTDSIFYTEGFLTKHFSFLPMESVADTENTQSFFSKIFGLHDVIVSSEGSNNNVLFKNMLDGEQMMKNIKYLKDSIIMGEKDVLEGEKTIKESLVGFKDKIEKPLDYNKDFKVILKMSMLKTVLIPILGGIILFILGFFVLPSDLTEGILGFIPVIIVLSIGGIIRAIFTTFIVEESSIEKKFEFLSKKHNTFSIEKITGVIIRESLLDKLIGTCSISFWSIGSSSSIKFSDIKKTPELEKNILSKVGIKLEEDRKILPVSFSFSNYLKSSIGLSIFLGFLFLLIIIASLFIPEINIIFVLLGLIVFIFLFFLIYFYKTFYYNKSRYIQRITNNFLESISGIFFVKKYYILFRNIKGIRSLKYPLTTTGTLVFDVSGEQIAQTKGQKSISIISNSVNVPFVSNIFETHEHFDNILNESVIDKSILNSAKQDIGNSIFIFVIFALIIFILSLFSGILIISFLVLALFSIIIGLIIWNIKVKYYNFEKNRVLFGYGIIYKNRHSIIYDKFNFIEKNQGFVNKIFKNGVVKIYTLGSGKVEMLLKDIDNYKEIYSLLKKD